MHSRRGISDDRSTTTSAVPPLADPMLPCAATLRPASHAECSNHTSDNRATATSRSVAPARTAESYAPKYATEPNPTCSKTDSSSALVQHRITKRYSLECSPASLTMSVRFGQKQLVALRIEFRGARESELAAVRKNALLKNGLALLTVPRGLPLANVQNQDAWTSKRARERGKHRLACVVSDEVV